MRLLLTQIITCILSLALFNACSPITEKQCGFTVQNGQRLKRLPSFTFHISTEFSTEQVSAIRAAADTVNAAASTHIFSVELSNQHLTAQDDGVNSVLIGDAENANGRTRSFYKGALIYDSDIIVDSSKQTDLQSLMTHEFMHALGMGHSTDFNSVMYQYLGPLDIKRQLTDADVQNLRCQY